MKNLSEYLNKEVKIVDIDGEIFIGIVQTYTPQIDSDEDQDEIAISVDDSLIGFMQNEIKSIEGI